MSFSFPTEICHCLCPFFSAGNWPRTSADPRGPRFGCSLGSPLKRKIGKKKKEREEGKKEGSGEKRGEKIEGRK